MSAMVPESIKELRQRSRSRYQSMSKYHVDSCSLMLESCQFHMFSKGKAAARRFSWSLAGGHGPDQRVSIARPRPLRCCSTWSWKMRPELGAVPERFMGKSSNNLCVCILIHIMYIYIYIYLFICLFIYLFIYLLIYIYIYRQSSWTR